MNSCCCSMAGTRACMSCPQNPSTWIIEQLYTPGNPAIDKYMNRNRKITERFEDGKLVERIIE